LRKHGVGRSIALRHDRPKFSASPNRIHETSFSPFLYFGKKQFFAVPHTGSPPKDAIEQVIEPLRVAVFENALELLVHPMKYAVSHGTPAMANAAQPELLLDTVEERLVLPSGATYFS
jgi:hypothetical protein